MGFRRLRTPGAKVIPALAKHYKVVAPDLRGFGESDRPESGYDKRTVAEDIRQLVKQLGLGPINLISHDVGMMVGYAYAAAFPKDVKRLVLMEAALPGLVWRSCTTQTSTRACITCRCLKPRTGWRKR